MAPVSCPLRSNIQSSSEKLTTENSSNVDPGDGHNVKFNIGEEADDIVIPEERKKENNKGL